MLIWITFHCLLVLQLYTEICVNNYSDLIEITDFYETEVKKKIMTNCMLS